MHQQTRPELDRRREAALSGRSDDAVGCSEPSLRPGWLCEGNAEAPGAAACESGDSASGEPREPCPAPLSWQGVLEAFHAESESWQLERDGGLLRGRTWGDGPPVYFLNGLGGTHELFALTVWLLRERFRCVVFDYRQHPVGPGRRSPFSVDDLADDLLAIADLQGDRRFHLFATSMGVAVALSAMHKQPERIERAVFQGGLAHVRFSIFERLLIGLASRLTMELRHVPLRTAIQQQNHRRWFPPFDFTRWEFFAENTGRVPVSVLASQARALIGLDLRPLLGRIEHPVLIVRGEGEGILAARRSAELEALPGARVENMHTTGAVPFLTHPHRLAKRCGSFFLGEDEPVACAGED